MKWFRFYSEALHDPKVQLLPAETYRGWTQLLCLANETEPRGRLPKTMLDTAYKLHMDMAQAEALVADLADAGLIDRKNGRFLMHNWDVRQPDSDNIASRVQKHREKRSKPVTGNKDVTLPVTLHVTPSDRTCNVLDPDTDKKRLDPEQEPEKIGLPPYTMPVRSGCYRAIQDCFGRMITPVESELIKALEDEHPKERILYAVEQAAMSNARSLRFIKSVCERQEQAGDNRDAGRPTTTAVLSRPSESSDQYRAELARYGVKPVERV